MPRVRILLRQQSLLLRRCEHEQLQESRALPQVALRFLSAPRRGHQEAPLNMSVLWRANFSSSLSFCVKIESAKVSRHNHIKLWMGACSVLVKWEWAGGQLKPQQQSYSPRHLFQGLRQERIVQIDHKCIGLYLNIKNILRSYIYKISTEGNVLSEMKRCELRF